jgi:hypothetical protein
MHWLLHESDWGWYLYKAVQGSNRGLHDDIVLELSWLKWGKVLTVSVRFICNRKNGQAIASSVSLPVATTPANTQHCPYLTSLPESRYSSRIGTDPVQAAGAVPSSYCPLHLPCSTPKSSFEFTCNQQYSSSVLRHTTWRKVLYKYCSMQTRC